MRHKTALFTLFLALFFLLAACSAEPTTGTASSTAEPAGLDATLEAAGVIVTREPRPTATPGPLTKVVEDVAVAVHLQDITFLGLSSTDWINLGVSLFIIIIGYIIGSWLSHNASKYLSRYLVDEEAKVLLKKALGLLRWLVVLWALRIAILRLLFLSPGLKQGLETVIFVTAIVLLTRASWVLIDMAHAEALHRFRDSGREHEVAPALTLFVRVARIILILIATTALLSQFGINLTAFAAILGLTGLAFSLAARDTIADAIAGVIILLDRPFRVGDRIEVAAANTWGDVADIGLRTTRIRTRDNRLVIIPNSLISKNEIINYTYPDPTYRIETHVGLDYNTDIERAREIMIEALRDVPSVLDNRPIDVLYSDMGDSAMIFRVRWWIETYADTRRVTDQVHTALQHALDEAGIDSPFPTQSIFLHDNSPQDDHPQDDK